MDSFIDQLLKVLAVVFTALAVLGVWYWNYVRERKAEFADRASLAAWRPRLADSPRLVRYRTGIERVLDRVDGFFGEKLFGWRALITCWLIAFVYPLVLFMGTWAGGGPHTLGTLELLPVGWNSVQRWGFVVGVAVYVYGLFALTRRAKKVDVWLSGRLDPLFERLLRRLPAKLRRPVRALILGLVLWGFFYALAGDVPTAGFLAVVVVVIYVVAGDFAGVYTYAFLAVLVFAAGVAGDFAGTATAAVGVAGTVAGVLTPVKTGLVARVGARVGTILVIGSVVVAGAGYLSAGWVGIFAPDVVSFVVFFLILPLLNGLLDYVSWGVSRRLGRALLAHFGRYTAIVLAFVDLVCAVLLLGALAVVLCTAVEALNALALAKTGAEMLDLGEVLAEAATRPFGSGFWITAMLFSTLIPTVFHLGIAVASAVMVRSRSKDREAWVERIDRILAAENAAPISEIERGQIARYLFFHRVFGPLALTLTLMALGVWGWSILIGDISDTLLALANWSRDLVHGG